ncbi:MAG: GNAT family N-acetyltransferase [Alcaligenes sp.]
MKHDFVLEGEGFRLRPVTPGDVDFILELRCDEQLTQFLNPVSPDRRAQIDWLSEYERRPGDFYFVIERRGKGQPEGLVSLYDVQHEAGCAEWGRWILRKGSLAALESAWLVYRFAFERLGLQQVYCRTVRDNQAVVAFHDTCGCLDKTVLPAFFNIRGRRLDAVEHRVTAAAWEGQMAQRLQGLAARLAQRMNRHGG